MEIVWKTLGSYFWTKTGDVHVFTACTSCFPSQTKSCSSIGESSTLFRPYISRMLYHLIHNKYVYILPQINRPTVVIVTQATEQAESKIQAQYEGSK